MVIDPKKAANVLRWAVDEMEERYQTLSELGRRAQHRAYNAAIGAEDGRRVRAEHAGGART